MYSIFFKILKYVPCVYSSRSISVEKDIENANIISKCMMNRNVFTKVVFNLIPKYITNGLWHDGSNDSD